MLSGPETRQSREATMESGRVPRPTVDGAWLNDLRPVLDRLAVEIRGQLRREPDAGDLLLAFACAPDTLFGQALAELGVELDVLWGTIERAREKVTRAREQAALVRRCAIRRLSQKGCGR